MGHTGDGHQRRAVTLAQVRAGLKPWGRVDRRADPRALYVDYDRPWPPTMAWLLGRCRLMGIPATLPVEYRRTGKGWHVVITLSEPLTRAETIAAQAILGSDLVREAFNLFRARRSSAANRDWNLLFAEKPL